MEREQDQTEQSTGEHSEEYPVQEIYGLGVGEYPAGRKPAPLNKGEVIEASVQDAYSLGVKEYPAGRKPQPDPKT